MMEALRRALKGAAEPSEPAALDIPALEMASIEFPDVALQAYRDRLDAMAAELQELTAGLSGPEFLARANLFLFEDFGFSGNETNYYDPKNSCLNWVLDQRTGIPISLSLVYLELARRLRRPMFGIGLPGHFVVKYDDGMFTTYLDPFNAGKLLSEEDCIQLVRGIAGDAAALDVNLLRPVSPQYIFTRMLNNLRAAYFRSEQFDRAEAVLNLLIESSLMTAEYYKGRAIARFRLHRYRGAYADFQQYLTLDPEASDRDEVSKQMAVIHRYLASLN